MASTFEPKTHKQAIDEASRRAKQANDAIDVIDSQQSIHSYYDVLIECSPEDAAMLHAKGMEGAAKRRLRKKRCSDK